MRVRISQAPIHPSNSYSGTHRPYAQLAPDMAYFQSAERYSPKTLDPITTQLTCFELQCEACILRSTKAEQAALCDEAE